MELFIDHLIIISVFALVVGLSLISVKIIFELINFFSKGKIKKFIEDLMDNY